MGKAKPKKEKFGPTAQQMMDASVAALSRSGGLQPSKIIADEAHHFRAPVRKVIAYEEQCTSPMKRRQFKHRTDVLNDADLIDATKRSREFQEKYQRQGWSVIARAVLA